MIRDDWQTEFSMDLGIAFPKKSIRFLFENDKMLTVCLCSVIDVCFLLKVSSIHWEDDIKNHQIKIMNPHRTHKNLSQAQTVKAETEIIWKGEKFNFSW